MIQTPLVRLVDDDTVFCTSQKFLLQTRGWQVAVYNSARAFFMKGEREPGRTRAYRRPRYMFIVPSVATSARLTCRNQYGTRTRIHDSLVGEFDGVLFNCLLKVPDNFLHTVSMQSVSFPWAV